jgi:hypothetical protein
MKYFAFQITNPKTGSRTTLRVPGGTKKQAESVKRNARLLAAGVAANVPPDEAVNKWLSGVNEDLCRRLVKVGLCESPHERVNLSTAIEQFIGAATKGTRTTRQVTGNHLVKFFGGDKETGTISEEDADKWEAWLRAAADAPGGGLDQDENTARKHVKTAETLYGKLKAAG